MKRITNFPYLLASFAVPVFLVLFAVGILLSPIYIQVEYRLPGFPEDPYGFSREERLYWANISRKYLLNNQGIEYLADQKLSDNNFLYNERELRHMYDVKIVVRVAGVVFGGVVVYLVGLGNYSKKTARWRIFKTALRNGGWLTAGFILAILVYLALNFNSLFTNFHRIFFEGDTWLFRYSDTLIRLFPIRFWQDAFIWIGIMTLAAGFGLGYFLRDRS